MGVLDALGVIAGQGQWHLPAETGSAGSSRAGRGLLASTLGGQASGGVYARGVVDDRKLCRICFVIAANRFRARDDGQVVA